MDASEAKIDNVILPVTYKVPVTVEEEETMLTWTVDTLSEVRCLLEGIKSTLFFESSFLGNG